jgi:two-component system, NarL family, nitrate/nitrite response regulator NarL
MAAIRLLIVDDHTLFRHGLVSLLQNEPQLQVVGQAANGEQALRLAQQFQVDVVLMDLKMPGENGIEVMRRLLEVRDATRIIVLTVSEDTDDVLGAVRAGARGYILKNADADELVQTIRRVYAGYAVLSPDVTLGVLEALRSGMTSPSWDSQLTPRELEVLQLLIQGSGNRQIAAALSISENTVKTHVGHILEKLKLDSRRQVAAHAGPPDWRRPARHNP